MLGRYLDPLWGKIYAIRVISTKFVYGFKRLFEPDVKKLMDVMMYFFEDMAQYKVDMMLNLLCHGFELSIVLFSKTLNYIS